MCLDRLQTMRVTFEEICQGQDPWIPLGNFLNDWYAYHSDRRPELIADPIPSTSSPELQRWAAFCAASVEWFCNTSHLLCPSWVFSCAYTLTEPWFFHDREKVRQRLLATTPQEFTRRNIFCGNRVFANKYEFSQQYHRLSPPMSFSTPS